MADMTLPGIPTSIPRSTYLEMIERLGIDSEHLRELHWGFNTITAVVFALDENGNRYVDQAKMAAAVHEVCIRIDDDGREQ